VRQSNRQRGSIRGMIALVGACALAVGAFLGGGELGWWDDGAGPDAPKVETSDTPQPPASEAAARPLVIVLDGHQYLVAGQPVALEELAARFQKVPDGTGPAVVVERKQTSRAAAEAALDTLLKKLNIQAEWRPPL
jgi:hypothetical protein